FCSIVFVLMFIVERGTGKISRAHVPREVRFRDRRNRVKPVAPFLEVWADDGRTLVPLTETLAGKGTLEWRVTVGNIKAFRRTGFAGDRIQADTGWFSDHKPQRLTGHCQNFLPRKTLPFGEVQFLRPTAAFPEI